MLRRRRGIFLIKGVAAVDADRLLAFVREEAYRPLQSDELAEALGVSEADLAEFNALLAELQQQGRLLRTRRGRYAAPERLDLIAGTIQAHRQGFGFLLPEAPDLEDLHIAGPMLKGAMHGDKVLARRLPGNREGEVVRIIERSHPTVVGRIDLKGDIAFVSPLDPRLYEDVAVAREALDGARDGDLVVVAITRFPDGRRGASGRVQEVLGASQDPGVDVLAVVRKWNLPTAFPEAVLAEAAAIAAPAPDARAEGRLDLRSKVVMTIDAADAKDLDDAISLERQGEHWVLGVHIADVSYYVREGSALDAEARARGTSVYLVDRVVPMLPERLSNELCSLQPGDPRRTLSVFITMDSSGARSSMTITPSLIESHARLTYDGVNRALEGSLEEAERPLYEPLLPLLNQMRALRDLLAGRRAARGAVDFELPEEKVVLDQEGRPVRIVRRERTVADSIIEEFMLAANEAVAHFAVEHDLPFLFRVHERPESEKIDALREFLLRVGYSLPTVGRVRPRDLQEVLRRAAGRPEERLLSTVLLRAMQRARYSADNLGHFGLAASDYSHFTSPIRRYPDLMIHRILRESGFRGTLDEARRAHYRSILPEVALQSSELERRADEAERESVDLKKVAYMADKVGMEFEGVVSGVTSFGLFVELPLGVEGLLHVSALSDDYYHFDPVLFSLIGERSGRTFRLADAVQVRVERVSLDSREIDLALVDMHRRGNAAKGKKKAAKQEKELTKPPKNKMRGKAKREDKKTRRR